MRKLTIFFLLAICAFNLETHAASFHGAGEYLDDSVITTKIKAKFTKDPLLNPLDIHVSTNNGVVILEGTLKTKTELAQAVMLVESTEGVKDVVTRNLEVLDSQQPVTDGLLTGRVLAKIVKSEIFGDKEVKFWGVHVETKNGIVYLSGEVQNKFQKANLVQIAGDVAGKHAVNASDLKIRRR